MHARVAGGGGTGTLAALRSCCGGATVTSGHTAPTHRAGAWARASAGAGLRSPGLLTPAPPPARGLHA